MVFWKDEKFKAAQREWYARLESAGFEDAERFVGDELHLRQTAQHPYGGADALGRETRVAYYNLLAAFVCEAEFKNDIDALIMCWRATGSNIKEICQELALIGHRRCRNTVTFTIRKYEMKWGIRQYTAKQLNKKPAGE